MKINKTFLTVAASDTSGGAGIQQDIKTALYHNFWPFSVISANTAQSFKQVFAVEEVNIEFFRKQLDSVFNNFRIDCLKIGLIPNSQMLLILNSYLKHYNGISVLDPVLVSSSGHSFVDNDFIEVLKNEILPYITVITPNQHELQMLSGQPITDFDQATKQAEILSERYKLSVYVKGGHFSDNPIKEAFINTDFRLNFELPRFDWKYNHGTGCAFSSALAVNLILEKDINLAVYNASGYVRDFYNQCNHSK